MDENNVTLLIADQTIVGWKSVQVRRGIENLPSDFTVSLTLTHPDQAPVTFDPDYPQRVQVMFGSDKVLDGWIDTVLPKFDRTSEGCTIYGRSKCRDLVDGDALIPGSQMQDTDVVKFCKQLCTPMEIQVVSDDPGPPVNMVAVTLGETSWQIIDKVTKAAGFLAYDNMDGDLVLARAGTRTAATALVQGEVVSAQAAISNNDNFAEYRVYGSSVDPLADLAAARGDVTYNVVASANQLGIPRWRRKSVIGEQVDNLQSTAQRVVDWELNRRWGRSKRVQVTVDGWRDVSGALWDINTLAHIRIPKLRLPDATYLISRVEFSLNEQGATTTLELMPREAFSIQPIVVNPGLQADAAAAKRAAQSAATNP